jgi:hypothetical protein
VDVEAPQDVAAERIVSRWRQGFLAAAAEPANPGAQMGGRWIPRAAVDGLFTDLREHDGKPLHGKSVTEVNAREVSEESPSVTRYDLYRTKAVDRGADHVERHERTGGSDLQLTWQAPDTAAASTSNVDSAVLDGLRAASAAFPKPLGKVPRTTESIDGPETSGPELNSPGRDVGPEL